MAAELRRRIAEAEAGLQALRRQLARAEADEADGADEADEPLPSAASDADGTWKWPLQADDYERYARQLILPSIGVEGQRALQKASVVVVGAGGLGCPAALYLAGAGVGHLTLVDGDVVETSNLHRQIAHTAAAVGRPKVDSLAAACRARNPRVRCTAVRAHATPANIADLLGGSGGGGSGGATTLVLDCTDHAAVRYLVSDACVRAGLSLVSAAALRTDGQLAVLNWPPGRGPCYRCVFPRPPPAASQTSCAEGGVLGPVVGVMGVLQALEALRVLTTPPPPVDDDPLPPPTLLLFAAGSGGSPSFRTVRLRGRRPDCWACGAASPLRAGQGLDGGWPDYVQFCGGGGGGVGGSTATERLPPLPPDARVSVEAYRAATAGGARHWLLDVREKELFALGSLDGAVNVPFSQTRAPTKREEEEEEGAGAGSLPRWLPAGLAADAAPVYVVCRLGNDSQVVARQLRALGLDRGGARFVGDIDGGLLAWKRRVDATLPFV